MSAEYTISCDGKGAHPRRPLGVIYDYRQPFDAAQAEASVLKHRRLTDQLLPDRDRADDQPVADIVRRMGIAAGHVLYRRRRVRLDESQQEYIETGESIDVKVTKRGREFSFSCQTCRKQGRSPGVTRTEQQVHALIDVMAAAGCTELEISSLRLLARPANSW